MICEKVIFGRVFVSLAHSYSLIACRRLLSTECPTPLNLSPRAGHECSDCQVPSSKRSQSVSRRLPHSDSALAGGTTMQWSSWETTVQAWLAVWPSILLWSWVRLAGATCTSGIPGSQILNKHRLSLGFPKWSLNSYQRDLASRYSIEPGSFVRVFGTETAKMWTLDCHVLRCFMQVHFWIKTVQICCQKV